MPWTKVEFKPGIIKDDTSLATEGGYVDGNRVRFSRGKFQPIGGWGLLSFQNFPGIARAAHDWADLNGNPLMAWATAANLYALVGGARVDITPFLTAGVLLNPFSTTNGSAVVTVNHPLHGLATGNSITFSNATPVGGLTLNGDFVVAVTGQNTYTITAPTNAIATVTSGSGVPVDFVAPLPPGLVDALAVGYGSGAYGAGPYGASTITDTEPRTWSLDNFGENLVANPRGGGLYEWQPVFSLASPELIANGAFDTDTVWAKGTGWTISGGAANKAAGSAGLLSQSVKSLVLEGKVYRVTFTVARTAGSLKFQVNAGTGTPAIIDVNGASGTGASTPITQPGTYSRTFRAPAGPIDVVFSADAAFAGSIDNVSVKLETRAYRIEEAPRNIGFMFVDPNKFIVAMSTQEADGDFNPLLVRWCDQGNSRIWVPDTNNLAREVILSNGGQALSGIVSRKQNILWTDSAAFSMAFTQDADYVFSFDLLGTGCGIIGRNAAESHNGIVFWLSRSGFFVFQGSIPQKIDCGIERYVLDNLPPLETAKIYAGVNGQFSEIWWMYPDMRDGVECSRIAVFNFIEQHWSTHRLARTAWFASGIFPHPVGFSPDGLVYEHEVGQTANGNPIDWSVSVAAFDIEDGGNLAIVKEIVPDFDDQVGDVSFDVTPRLYPNATDLPVSTHLATPTTKVLRMRRKGRQMTVTMRSASSSSFARLGALRLNVEKAAAQR